MFNPLFFGSHNKADTEKNTTPAECQLSTNKIMYKKYMYVGPMKSIHGKPRYAYKLGVRKYQIRLHIIFKMRKQLALKKRVERSLS